MEKIPFTMTNNTTYKKGTSKTLDLSKSQTAHFFIT